MINGDKAFALLAAPRRRPEVPRAAIRNALKSNPGLSSRQQTNRTRQSGRPSTGTSAQQDSRLGARTRQRQAEVPQLRRNGARQPGSHINRFFSHPQGGRDGKPYRSTSYVNAPALPARRLCLALCSILICLVFCAYELLYVPRLGRSRAHRRGQAAQGPVAPGYSFAFSTPRSQWQAGTMPHIYQIDPAWSELPYAGGTIRQNACGPTCLTMVYIFKTDAPI